MAGHALGLHSSGMLSLQAVAAVLAGSLAEVVPTATAITVLAAASVLVTILLAPRLRDGDRWLATGPDATMDECAGAELSVTS
jgi:hypothetical protein